MNRPLAASVEAGYPRWTSDRRPVACPRLPNGPVGHPHEVGKIYDTLLGKHKLIHGRPIPT